MELPHVPRPDDRGAGYHSRRDKRRRDVVRCHPVQDCGCVQRHGEFSMFPFDFFSHRRDCQNKQNERTSRITQLPYAYHAKVEATDRKLLNASIQDIVADVRSGNVKPVDILRTYGKVAVQAQAKTNCVTEVMLPHAEEWARRDVNLKGPLAGIPISLKDSIGVGGYDTSVGYSSNAGKPTPQDGAIVRILKDAGAIPYVKTNLPITLLSFESTNDTWGRTTNPHNAHYSPGGSTGGESALIAFGGSRIGIGSDVAGSVRVPAHFAGIYALRCSTGRWPKGGIMTSMPGQEGVPSVYSPMARTLNDLTYFTRSIVGMQPWRYDHSVHPIAWRGDQEQQAREQKRFRIGVMRDDGIVPPSPACERALNETASALRSLGHEVFDVSPPSPYEGLVLASRLLNADGCRTFYKSFRTGEHNDPGAEQMRYYAFLSQPLKWLHYLWVRYVRQDSIWAGLIRGWGEHTASQQWELVARREAYKARWHDWWNSFNAEKGGEVNGAGIDFIITVPNATPATPHGAMKDAFSSCGYTFLFNLLDYTAGVLPVTHVDAVRDALPPGTHRNLTNAVARGAYKHYDAEKMHGLPVGVQIVGRRLQEEWVLGVMQRVENALHEAGSRYEQVEFWT